MTALHGGDFLQMKANRYATTLVILVTLALGILIGTVVATGVKGKTVDSSDASPLQIDDVSPQAYRMLSPRWQSKSSPL